MPAQWFPPGGQKSGTVVYFGRQSAVSGPTQAIFWVVFWHSFGRGFGQFTGVFLLWFGHKLAIFRLRRAFCRAFPPNPPDRREKAAKNGWILPGRAPSHKYFPPQKYSALTETGTVVSMAQTPGTVVCLGTVPSAKSLAQWLSKNPNRSPESKFCMRWQLNGNYMAKGLRWKIKK